MREFLDWVEQAPSDQRAEAAWSVATAFLSDDIDDESRTGLEAGLTLFLDDPVPEVRMALAEALGDSPRAPHHVILTLAADLPDIAEHVLSRSPVMADGELVDIAAAADESIQMAIAGRPEVSSSISAALAEVGGRLACLTLLTNPGASIARVSFRRIAERFGGESDLREAMLDRDDLPAATRQYLAQAVSAALGRMPLVGAFLPEARRADDLARIVRAGDDRDRGGVRDGGTAGAGRTSARHRPAHHGADPAGAVRRQRRPSSRTALSLLSKAPLARVQRLLRARRLFGLRSLYARAGLSPEAFPAFLAALDTLKAVAAEGGQPDRYRMTVRIVEAVLARYAAITDVEKNELTTMLRRFAADQARDAARDYSRAVVAA